MKKIILITLILTCFSFKINSQKNLTLYNMEGLSQTVYVNPSSMPKNRIYISLPLGMTNISYMNSGFKYSELLTGSGKELTFDKSVVDKLDDKSNLTFDWQQEFLGVGFKAFGTYLNVSVIAKTNASLIYPKDLIKLVVEGNGSSFLGERANLDGLSMNLNSYMEYGVGVTKSLGQKLTVGGKIKLLSGIANFNTKNFNLGLYTDPTTYDITLDGSAEFNTSNIDGLVQDSTKKENLSKLKSAGFNFKNAGIGFDLGATFNLNEKLSISASIIDIGSIKWKSNTKSYIQEGINFTYSGVDFAQFLDKSDTTSPFKEFSDSLINNFKQSYNTDSYRTGLGTKYYLGAKYQLTKKLSANFLIYSNFLKHKYIPGFTIGLTKVSKIFTSSINYSIVNKTWGNIGIGLSAKIFSMQFYFITDNILGVFNYQKARYVNYSFGVSIAIKDRSIAKTIVDKILPGDQSK
jgi:hypothetical protein